MNKKKLTKEDIERMCRAAGMMPESREKFASDYELYLADGYSLPPHNNFRKMGIEPNEFPCGMYATMWWLSREGTEELHIGSPAFRDLFHSPELIGSDKKRARLNTARIDAAKHLRMMKKHGTKH